MTAFAPSPRLPAGSIGHVAAMPPLAGNASGSELKLRTPGWRARRWVVEACHSWLNRTVRCSSAGPRRTQPPRAAAARQRPHRVQNRPHRPTSAATQPG